MTDSAETEITSEEAEAELARLGAAVVNGEEVTIAELTHAKERISFAQLLAKGSAARVAKKREQEAAERRGSAKRDVAAMFTDGRTATRSRPTMRPWRRSTTSWW